MHPQQKPNPDDRERIDWVRCIPFIALHVACLGAIWTGVSLTAAAAALILYLIRMFAITGFYHRYFSHRCFKTSRPVQFLLGALGASAAQRGPLWWAAHHRHHHIESDTELDLHSPVQRGFLWAHMGWFMTRGAYNAPSRYTKDWNRFPELVFLDRNGFLVPILLAGTLFALGELLHTFTPRLNTNGWQLLVWGFVISTVMVYHATYSINSLAHVIGKRRYDTPDDSRNNFWLALVTLGEGWHNNHHHYPAAARQGFFWWEIDLTWYGLLLLRKLGVIWDVRNVPEHARQRNRIDQPTPPKRDAA